MANIDLTSSNYIYIFISSYDIVHDHTYQTTYSTRRNMGELMGKWLPEALIQQREMWRVRCPNSLKVLLHNNQLCRMYKWQEVWTNIQNSPHHVITYYTLALRFIIEMIG